MAKLWSQQLAQGFTKPKQLLQFLDVEITNYSIAADKEFATRVPLSFAEKMQKGNINCPLLKQVLPIADEMEKKDSYLLDPLQEQQANPIRGLLHKYHSRALLTLAPSCAINCRYCFRRHFPYDDNKITPDNWQSIINYLADEPSINEVIFSGGDPLMVKNSRLAKYIADLEQVASIKTLRLHSRMPVVLPARVDLELINLLAKSRFKVVLVIHCNHPNELCCHTAKIFKALKEVGITLLNQSVLLKGVNDKAEILEELSQKLFEQDIMPYYLHLLDKVAGAAHFDLPLAKAKQIYNKLQILLAGYLVPKLVCERAGVKHKSIITS